MCNQIKAEFYKLIKSKQFFITIGICLLLFLLMIGMANGEGGFFMGSYIGYEGNEPILNGFIGFFYEDAANPTMWEIIYSAVAFTGILWVVMVALGVPFYLNEFKNGTIKLNVAYGKSKLQMVLAKLVVINTYFSVIFYTFCFMALFYVANQMNYHITCTLLLNTLKLVTLDCMVYIAITFFLYFFCTIIKNNVVALTIFILYIFSMIFILLATYDRDVSIFVNAYNHINPMYYLWNASAFWAYPKVAKEIIVYFVISIPTLSIGTYLLLKKQELK